jgi:primosomal protein N' (replication factor Y)
VLFNPAPPLEALVRNEAVRDFLTRSYSFLPIPGMSDLIAQAMPEFVRLVENPPSGPVAFDYDTIGDPDTGLTIPDFRSAEKTFQLLTQVAGRSGREKPGEVIIQTYKPEHFAIQTTVQHDYLNFYTQELHHRRESLFPPFQKLIKLTIENIDQEKAYYFSHQLYKDLQKFQADNPQLISEINLFPALISKLKNKYRWQILLNGANPHLFMQKFYLQKPFKNDIKIDVDPLNTI